MNARRIAAAFAALIAFAAPQSEARRLWMLPSATVLSGEAPWITVDASFSSELFQPSFALTLDGLLVTAPDGSTVAASNLHRGQKRSSFDLKLEQEGTYTLSLMRESVFAFWQQDGEQKRWIGTPEGFAANVPADAAELRASVIQRRIDTFVTRRAPTAQAGRQTGKGLELVPVTHPNDLMVDEAARFRLLLDGKPATGLEVTIVPGGNRYRDQVNETVLRTDADGAIAFTFPQPGMYWLGASVRDDNSGLPRVARRASYSATFEVLP